MELAVVDTSKEWTLKDYLELGEECWYQLIDGQLVMSPSPSLKHQITIGKVFKVLDAFAETISGLAVLSPIDIYFDDRNVLQPDVLLVSKERKNILSERGLEGAPDLIVEVLSISNSTYDRYEKKKKYCQFGVLEYWLIDPVNETIEVFSLQEDLELPKIYATSSGTFYSLQFPNLKVTMEQLFK